VLHELFLSGSAGGEEDASAGGMERAFSSRGESAMVEPMHMHDMQMSPQRRRLICILPSTDLLLGINKKIDRLSLVLLKETIQNTFIVRL
jgi:hypothetical protein